jgi:hypothetical protein
VSDQFNTKAKSYLSDSPISNASDDLLGWDRLADQIVGAVRDNRHKRGFVIGIQGKWGSGKSSMLNLINHKLRVSDDVRVVEYSPWLTPDANHVSQFFGELGKEAKYKFKDKKLGKRISQFGKKLEHAGEISGGFGGIISVIVSVILATTLFTSQPPIMRLLTIVAAITALFAPFSRIGKGLGSLFSSDGETLSIVEMKKQLQQTLGESEHQYVILIDDIDRLAPKEICELFQLVKNNGDLENVTYVLAFDSQVVKKVLSQEYSDEYLSFADKIVQIEFTLPSPDAVVLNSYFTEKLDEVLAELPDTLESYWEPERWANFNFLYFRRLFGNFRDLKRVVNALRLNFPLVFNDGVPEVNPVDFMAIEVVRLKYPRVYDFIRANRGAFIEISDPTRVFGPDKDEHENLMKEFDTILADISSLEEQERLRSLLVELFPAFTRSSTRSFEAPASASIVRNKLRICSEEVFDRYVLYGNFQGDIPNSTIHKIISAIVSMHRDLPILLEPYHNTDILRVVLDRVTSKIVDVGDVRPYAGTLLTLLLDQSDYLIESPMKSFGSPVRFFVYLTAREILLPFEPEHRANIVQTAYEQTSGKYGPIILLALFESEHKEASEVKPLITLERLEIVRRIISNRGEKWLEESSILANNHFPAIASCLRDWIPADDFKTAFHVLLLSEENIKVFLSRYLIRSETLKIGRVAGPVEYRFNFEGMDKIIDLKSISTRVASLTTNENDRPETVRAIELFRLGVGAYLDSKPRRQ